MTDSRKLNSPELLLLIKISTVGVLVGLAGLIYTLRMAEPTSEHNVVAHTSVVQSEDPLDQTGIVEDLGWWQIWGKMLPVGQTDQMILSVFRRLTMDDSLVTLSAAVTSHGMQRLMDQAMAAELLAFDDLTIAERAEIEVHIVSVTIGLTKLYFADDFRRTNP